MGKQRRGRLWYVVENMEPSEEADPEVLLWLALPVDHRGQRVRIGDIHPRPVEVIEEPLGGNRVAFFRETEIRTGEPLRFTADFLIEVDEVTSNVDPAAIEPYDTDSEEYRRYTVSERWIEITPEIAAKACEIADGEENPWLAARRVFDWVIRNISYEYPAMEDRGAERSYARRKGDCGEFSVIFIAMCRALGIPARVVVCNWFTGSGHAWAEILVPPYGWLPVDTSAANIFVPGAAEHGEVGSRTFRNLSGLESEDPNWLFGNLYPNRIIVCVGNNLEIYSEKTGLSRTFLMMQPGGHTAYPPAIEFTGVGEKVAHTHFYLFDDEAADEEAARKAAQKGLAVAFYEVQDYERAEPGLKRVVAEKPEDALSWLYLAQIYATWSDFGKAAEAYRACIDGEAGSIMPVLDAWAHIGLGNCHDVAGRREEAVAEYRAVLDSGVDFQGSAAAAQKHIDEPFVPD